MVCYFLGEWLQSIYGLDPPYAYYIIGNILVLISIILSVFLIVWGAFCLLKKIRNKTLLCVLLLSMIIMGCKHNSDRSNNSTSVTGIWCGKYQETTMELEFYNNKVLKISSNKLESVKYYPFSLTNDTLIISGFLPSKIELHNQELRITPLNDELKESIDLIHVIDFRLTESSSTTSFPFLKICKNKDLEIITSKLYNDTLVWGNDTSTINWYLPLIENIKAQVIKNCNDSKHIVFPYQSFDKVIYYSSLIDLAGTSLSTNKSEKLVKIINNPLNFGWGETTFEPNQKIVFEYRGTEIARIEIMDNKILKSSPENAFMKFGQLKGIGYEAFNQLIQSIQ